MIRPQELRVHASLLVGGATIPPARGDYMAERLVAFAAQDEATAGELRTAAHQLAASVDTLTGCTPDQRFELRGLASFLLAHADRLCPCAAVYDPDEGNVVRLPLRGRMLESPAS